MKKLLLLLFLLIPMAGCDRTFMDEPFVVNTVIELKKERCLYCSNTHTHCLRYSCGLYNIGDTIKLDR